MMTVDVWIELADAEERAVWDRFYRDFAFRPSVHSEQWPSIREPVPSITYAIPDDFAEADLDELDQHVLRAFRACTRPGGRLYALDWQHTCFWFRPHGEIESWRIPVFPDGDYSIFLAEDFRFGIFGHPWERTWCIFGAELVVAIEAGKPRLFSAVKRRSGAAG